MTVWLDKKRGGWLKVPLRRRDGSVRAVALLDTADAHLAEKTWHWQHGYASRKEDGQLQCQNMSPQKGCSSAYRGVGFDKARGKWIAYGRVNYKQFNLGRFVTEQEAVEVVEEFRATRMPFSEEAAN